MPPLAGRRPALRTLLLTAALLSLAVAQPPGEAALRRARHAQPRSFPANFSLGQFLLESGKPAEAIPFLATAVELQPGAVPARHDLAVAYIETGQLPEAQKLIQELPASPAAVHLEAQWLAAAGQPAPAAEKFQQAAEAEPSETYLFDWASHLLNNGASEPALKIFRYAVNLFPKSARLKVAQGVALYARSEFDEAARSVCAGVDLNPADLRPLVFLGSMLDLSPESAALVRVRLRGFAVRYPSHAQAQYLYGLSLAKSDKPASAEPFLRRALTLDARLPEARLELGKLYADTGRAAEAIQEFQAALRLAPELEIAHYRLGQLYRRTGQAALANQHLATYRRLHAKKEAEKKSR